MFNVEQIFVFIMFLALMFVAMNAWFRIKYCECRAPEYKLDDYVITSSHFVGKITKIMITKTRDEFWREVRIKIEYLVSNSVDSVLKNESTISRKLSEVEYAAYLTTCDQEKKSKRSVSSIFCQEFQVVDQPALNSVSYPDGFPPEKTILGDK